MAKTFIRGTLKLVIDTEDAATPAMVTSTGLRSNRAVPARNKSRILFMNRYEKPRLFVCSILISRCFSGLVKLG